MIIHENIRYKLKMYLLSRRCITGLVVSGSHVFFIARVKTQNKCLNIKIIVEMRYSDPELRLVIQVCGVGSGSKKTPCFSTRDCKQRDIQTIIVC